MVTKPTFISTSAIYTPDPILKGDTKVMVEKTAPTSVATYTTPLVGQHLVATTTSSTWESIEIQDFATKQEIYDLLAKLTEKVYEQEIRIQELEGKLNER